MNLKESMLGPLIFKIIRITSTEIVIEKMDFTCWTNPVKLTKKARTSMSGLLTKLTK
jgi:hypothetical protein